MKKHVRSICILIILGSMIASSCSKNNDGSNGYNNNNNNNNNNNSPNSVNIANMSFGPTSLTVKAGTTVTWTNNDNTSHTVTADDGSFDSGNMSHGATFSHTFSTAGSYPYHCAYHSMMTATVKVN